MTEVGDAYQTFQEWLQSINLLEAAIIIWLLSMLLGKLFKLYIPLRNFVQFVDTMQKLPSFIETTNKRFLVLFKHLDIDPLEVEELAEDDNDSAG